MESVTDETGKNVILTQTGQYLDALGMLTIKADGTIGSTLLSCDDLISIPADGKGESGGFLHTSGLKYTLDLTIPSTVQKNEKNVWIGGPTGEYRVHDVQVLNNKTGVYEPLDLTAKYNLAGYNYTLRDLGDGFAMFDGAINVLDYVAEDYMVLANYIESFPVNNTTGLHTIDAASGYADINGDGRITIIYSSETDTTLETNTPVVNTESTSYIVVSGDSLWKIAQKYYGKGSDWTKIYDANKHVIANPHILFHNQALAIPQ